MKSESGAGQVSLLWFVFLIVIVLGLAGFTYVVSKDKADLEEKYTASVTKEKETFDKNLEISERINQICAVVGFRDSVTAPSNLESIQDVISNAKDRHPDYVSGDVNTLDEVIDGMKSAYTALEQQRTESQQNFDNEVELRRAAEENVNAIESDKNRRISELEASLSDEQQRAQDQIDEDNQRISNLRSQLDEAEQRVRESDNQVSTMQERYDKEISLLNARIMALSKKLEILREPEGPDGRVLSTSGLSGLAMIDIGRKDGLRKGTKFEVFQPGKGGDLIPKGWIEVREVDAESAKCGITELLDPYNPIIQGDVVFNPHFARNMEKRFVFLGQFPASLDEEFVKGRLAALGAVVEDKVNSNTDFLVLGEKDKSEFATELTDMPDFKLATQLGVQILRVRELAAFIDY